MNSRYNRLIYLAEELDTPTSLKKISELNKLLADTSPNEVKESHASLLDDLISIMHNTGNILIEHEAAILLLQESIRGVRNE